GGHRRTRRHEDDDVPFLRGPPGPDEGSRARDRADRDCTSESRARGHVPATPREPVLRLRVRAMSAGGTIRRLWAWGLRPRTTGPRATLAIRLMAGAVFLWEGILKFVYVNQGVGRFTKLGIPFPLVSATFVGWLEIVGGILLILGLGTRLIAIPLIVEML